MNFHDIWTLQNLSWRNDNNWKRYAPSGDFQQVIATVPKPQGHLVSLQFVLRFGNDQPTWHKPGSKLKPPKRRVTALVPRRTQDMASALSHIEPVSCPSISKYPVARWKNTLIYTLPTLHYRKAMLMLPLNDEEKYQNDTVVLRCCVLKKRLGIQWKNL